MAETSVDEQANFSLPGDVYVHASAITSLVKLHFLFKFYVLLGMFAKRYRPSTKIKHINVNVMQYWLRIMTL